MSNFSSTKDADGYCAACDQANIFYLGEAANQCGIDVSGTINGQTTPLLQPGEICRLPNSQPETSNALALLIEGREQQICSQITDISTVTRPEDLRVALGMDAAAAPFLAPASAGVVTNQQGVPFSANTSVSPLVPIGQVSSARLPYQRGSVTAGHERNALDVMSDTTALHTTGNLDAPSSGPRVLTAIQAHPSLGLPAFSGPCNVADLNPAEEEWLVRAALAVIGPVQWVDQMIGATALGEAHGVDMSLTGTNLPGAVIEILEILLSGNRRGFLIEMFGQRISKVWVNATGNVMISFTGNKLLRKFVTGNVYGAANARISLVETAARTRVSPGAAVRAVGSRAGVLSLGFVTFFNVAEWLSDPASERDVNALIATVAWDLAAVSVSIIVGALASAAVLFLAAPIAATAVLVGVGIAAGVVAGLALDWVENRLGIKAAIKNALDDATVNDLDPVLYQDMMTAP